MIPELSELKLRRRTAGLTQQQLAKLSGVSQSLIAKIESAHTVPGFEKAKKLFDCLEKVHEENKITAASVMRRRIYSVSPNESVKKAVLLMENKAVSQLPVLEKHNSVGAITEKDVLAKLGKFTEAVDLEKLKVKEIMEEALPIIQENSPLHIISPMLGFHAAVLVGKKGRITGIITKSDLLKIVVKGK